MSTIVALAESGLVVLGTDSRFMRLDNNSAVSDNVEKISEVGPGLFIATSGWLTVCDFQVQKARELIRDRGITDVRELADALDQELRPFLQRFITDLSDTTEVHSVIADAVSGAAPFAGLVLAGCSGGKPGYVTRQYWFRDGQIELDSKEWFGPGRKAFITRGELVGTIARDPNWWNGGPIRLMRKFLSELKRHPQIGGPDQIVLLDRNGTHWISRLETPEAPEALLAKCAHPAFTAATLGVNVEYAGTIYASQVISGDFTGCTLELSSGGTTTEIKNQYDAYVPSNAVGLKIADSTSRNILHSRGLAGLSSTGYEFFQLQGINGYGYLHLNNPSNGYNLTATLAGDGLIALNAGPTAGITINANRVVGPRQAAVTAPSGGSTIDTQARTAINDLISRLQAHGLIS